MIDVDFMSDTGIAVLTVRQKLLPTDLVAPVRNAHAWQTFSFRWLIDVRAALLHGLGAADFAPLLESIMRSRPPDAPEAKVAVLGKSFVRAEPLTIGSAADRRLPLLVHRFVDHRSAMLWLMAPDAATMEDADAPP